MRAMRNCRRVSGFIKGNRRGTRLGNQPILKVADPAAIRAARLLAAARIRTSLPFMFFDHLLDCVHRALLLDGTFRSAWGSWVDLGQSLRRGTPHAPGSSPGTLSCQHVSPRLRPLPNKPRSTAPLPYDVGVAALAALRM